MVSATMKTIRIFTFDGVNVLDISGPAQVFVTASQGGIETGEASEASYSVELVSRLGGAVMTSAGFSIGTTQLEPEPIDTFLVVGGLGTDAARRDGGTLELIRRQAGLARRVGSICTGALLLAQAGLLNGRKATTHWGYCEAMAKEFPALRVMPSRGPFVSSHEEL